MAKAHYTAKEVAKVLQVNREQRNPFYTNSIADHLANTKHSKAWNSYGYQDLLTFAMHFDMYRRVGLAYAGVSLPVDTCWAESPRVHIGEEDDDETPQEKEFNEFAKRVKLWKNLRQVDEMQRVGSYAGLLIRVRDARDPTEPIMSRLSLDQVASLQPVWEGQLIPGSLDMDETSMRYGLPLEYTYSQQAKGANDSRELQHQTVHWTRVIIFSETAIGNSIYGRSALEQPFNALLDWEKIRGAGGEGFWRAAAQRLVLKTQDGEMPSREEVEDINEMIADMYAGFDDVPGLGGYDLEPLQTTLPTSNDAKQTALEDVAAGFKIAAKVLIGAQTGVLAGNEDGDQFRANMHSRSQNWCTELSSQVIEWLTNVGALEGEEWEVTFPDLTEPNQTQKLENAKKMKEINGNAPESVFDTDEIRVAAGFPARTPEQIAAYEEDLLEQEEDDREMLEMQLKQQKQDPSQPRPNAPSGKS